MSTIDDGGARPMGEIGKSEKITRLPGIWPHEKVDYPKKTFSEDPSRIKKVKSIFIFFRWVGQRPGADPPCSVNIMNRPARI